MINFQRMLLDSKYQYIYDIRVLIFIFFDSYDAFICRQDIYATKAFFVQK